MVSIVREATGPRLLAVGGHPGVLLVAIALQLFTVPIAGFADLDPAAAAAV